MSENKKTAKEINDAAIALNKEIDPIFKKHGFILGAEAYLENGVIKARPVVAPAQDVAEKGKEVTEG